MTMHRLLALTLSATALLAFSSVRVCRAELVVNGGFETGNFTGWTQFGNTAFTGVLGGLVPHSGSFGAFFGPIGSNGGIFQSLATVPGQTYQLSFWFSSSGGSPTFFQASWAGAALVSLTNPPPSGFTQFSFIVTATAAATDLRFTFRNDPDFHFLDDVSVVAPVPEPLSLLGWGLLGGAACLITRRWRKAT